MAIVVVVEVVVEERLVGKLETLGELREDVPRLAGDQSYQIAGG